MTDQFLPAGRFAERDFSAGDVFNRTVSIFSRNLLPFGIISAIAYFPSALALSPGSKTAALAASGNGGWIAVGFIATLVLNVLSQAIVLYGAFEDMRGLPVNLGELIKVGLRRFFPVLGVAICMPLLAGLAAILLLFPGLMVMTMLFVSVPACVVERLGPFKSMGRSAWLTKGHRWKIFGIWIAVLFVGGIAQSILNGSGEGGRRRGDRPCRVGAVRRGLGRFQRHPGGGGLSRFARRQGRRRHRSDCRGV